MGRLIGLRNVNRSFKGGAERAGVRLIKVHGVRRTCGSLLGRAGRPSA